MTESAIEKTLVTRKQKTSQHKDYVDNLENIKRIITKNWNSQKDELTAEELNQFGYKTKTGLSWNKNTVSYTGRKDFNLEVRKIKPTSKVQFSRLKGRKGPIKLGNKEDYKMQSETDVSYFRKNTNSKIIDNMFNSTGSNTAMITPVLRPEVLIDLMKEKAFSSKIELDISKSLDINKMMNTITDIFRDVEESTDEKIAFEREDEKIIYPPEIIKNVVEIDSCNIEKNISTNKSEQMDKNEIAFNHYMLSKLYQDQPIKKKSYNEVVLKIQELEKEADILNNDLEQIDEQIQDIKFKLDNQDILNAYIDDGYPSARKAVYELANNFSKATELSIEQVWMFLIPVFAKQINFNLTAILTKSNEKDISFLDTIEEINSPENKYMEQLYVLAKKILIIPEN